jgi:DNA repair exonuclease SbcCD ATPase subunit
MMGSSSATLATDLKTLGDLATLLKDPVKTDQLVSDLQARTDAALSAEASANTKLASATAQLARIEAKLTVADNREKTIASLQTALDTRTQDIKQREDALASNTAALNSQSKDLIALKAQIQTDQASADQYITQRTTIAQADLDKRSADLKAREDAVTAREQLLANAQADLDAWKAKVAAAAALVAAVGKN